LALIAVGTKGQKLDDTALRKHPELLGCYEVERRLGSTADDDARAKCAVVIIKDWVEAIPNKTDREIMTAALAVIPKFQGIKISEREHKMPGMTPNLFKKHRNKLLKDLVLYLYGYQQSSSEPSTDSISVSEPERRAIAYALTCFGRSAYMLHFATLACLLPRHIDANADEAVTPSGDKWACTEHMLRSFIGFRSMAAQVATIPPIMRMRIGIRGYTEDTDHAIVSLIDAINACWPLGREFDDERVLNSTHQATLELGYKVYHYDLFEDVWQPWYMEQIRSADAREFQLIVTSTRRIGELILTSINHAWTDQATGEAHKAIEHYYGCRFTTGVSGERTLGKFVEEHFRQHAMLAKIATM
jgi:hypothetical protein